MKTEQDDLLIERYVGGGMTGEERARFERRLASDQALRGRVDIERFMIRSMRGDRAASAAIDHSGARARALDALRNAPEPVNEGRRKPVAGWWSRGKLGGLALLLAAGSIGVGTYMKGGNDAPTDQGSVAAPTATAPSASRPVPPVVIPAESAAPSAAAPSTGTTSATLPTRATVQRSEAPATLDRKPRTESPVGGASTPAAVSHRDTVVKAAPHQLPSFEDTKAKGEIQVDIDGE